MFIKSKFFTGLFFASLVILLIWGNEVLLGNKKNRVRFSSVDIGSEKYYIEIKDIVNRGDENDGGVQTHSPDYFSWSTYTGRTKLSTDEDFLFIKSLFTNPINDETPVTLKGSTIQKPFHEVLEERMKALPFIKSNEKFGDRPVTRLCLPHYSPCEYLISLSDNETLIIVDYSRRIALKTLFISIEENKKTK